MRYSLLLWPHSNGRYEQAILTPAANELSLILSSFDIDARCEAEVLCGVRALSFDSELLSEQILDALSAHSHAFWVCVQEGNAFVPLRGACVPTLGGDLPYILKYKGKTNERFTSMLINLAYFASDYSKAEHPTLFDPMCGKGTALFLALNRGFDACGTDIDKKSVAEAVDYFKKYLETHKIKHTSRVSSQTIGKTQAVSVHSFEANGLKLNIASADGGIINRVYTKQKANIIVADLPYGVQHAPGRLEKFDQMLEEALPAWKDSLLPGGTIAVAFNTHTLPLEKAREVMEKQGLTPLRGGIWDNMSHWVEQAIIRDVAVCKKL